MVEQTNNEQKPSEEGAMRDFGGFEKNT